MAPTPTMEPSSGEEEWRRMTREHPVMRMSRNDKGNDGLFSLLYFLGFFVFVLFSALVDFVIVVSIVVGE